MAGVHRAGKPNDRAEGLKNLPENNRHLGVRVSGGVSARWRRYVHAGGWCMRLAETFLCHMLGFLQGERENETFDGLLVSQVPV